MGRGFMNPNVEHVASNFKPWSHMNRSLRVAQDRSALEEYKPDDLSDPERAQMIFTGESRMVAFDGSKTYFLPSFRPFLFVFDS
jgi:hypothetical protein